MKHLNRLLIGLAVLLPQTAGAADKIEDLPGNNSGRIESQSSFNNLGGVVESLFKILIIFLPAVATFYLALSGYRYVVAQGNPDLIEKAKKSLTYAVFGVVIAYGSVAIIYTVARKFGINTGFTGV